MPVCIAQTELLSIPKGASSTKVHGVSDWVDADGMQGRDQTHLAGFRLIMRTHQVMAVSDCCCTCNNRRLQAEVQVLLVYNMLTEMSSREKKEKGRACSADVAPA